MTAQTNNATLTKHMYDKLINETCLCTQRFRVSDGGTIELPGSRALTVDVTEKTSKSMTAEMGKQQQQKSVGSMQANR